MERRLQIRNDSVSITWRRYCRPLIYLRHSRRIGQEIENKFHMSISDIKTLFEAGSHFGFPRARRHPTAAPFLFGTKDRTDIFDLELTEKRLGRAHV